MITTAIILGFLFILLIGFIQIYRKHSRIEEDYDFAFDYRDKFINFSNKYFQNYDSWQRSVKIDNELYIWLTKNVNKIQNNIGPIGVMEYFDPYLPYSISNYHIIINTIPKFREMNIKGFDIHSVDDCLLRYLGNLEDDKLTLEKNAKNPFIWFRIGFKEIMNIPLWILIWFGIFSKRTVNTIVESFFYRLLTGIIALVTLVSGIVTIIQGKEKTIEFINAIWGK